MQDDRLCLYSNSGEQIEVVRVENNVASAVEIGGVQIDVNVVQIDSDDDDDSRKVENSISTPRSADEIEKKLTDLGLENVRKKSNLRGKVNHDAVPSIIIDLLDDSDEEPEAVKKVTSNQCVDNITKYLESGDDNDNDGDDNDDEDDDVIFVGCDLPTPSSSKSMFEFQLSLVE